MSTASMRRRRVRVWFGEHPICTHDAEPVEAERYATAMRQRFRGLRVTVTDAPGDGPEANALPDWRLWPSTVQ